MDKEAQEKIARIIASTHSTFDERWAPATADEFYDEADEVLKALCELGYRKLPEGEPPLLSSKDIGELCIAHYAEKWDRETAEEVVAKVTFEFSIKVAQAQRDSDIKWIRGEW